MSYQTFYVVNPLREVLLGLPALEILGIVKFADAVSSGNLQYEAHFPDMFHSLGTMPGQYTIRLQPGVIPCAINAPRRVRIALRGPLKREIQRMECMGIIRKVDNPTQSYALSRTCPIR